MSVQFFCPNLKCRKILSVPPDPSGGEAGSNASVLPKTMLRVPAPKQPRPSRRSGSRQDLD